MRIDRDMLGWGVFFLVAGGVSIGVQQGAIPLTFLDRWSSFWPLILVGIGLSLILARTALDLVGGLIISATLGLMVGGALTVGLSGIGDFSSAPCGPDEDRAGFAPVTGTFGSQAEVAIDLDCGVVSLGSAPGSGWEVTGRDATEAGPDIESTSDRLDIEPAGDGPVSILDTRADWSVVLPTDPRLDIALDINAGSLTADLTGARIGELDLELNAGSADLTLIRVATFEALLLDVNAGSALVTLPNLSFTGGIDVNAGSVALCVPAGAGLRIATGDSVLSSNDFAAAGLTEENGIWRTPGFAQAPVQIDLDTDANAASIRLLDEECPDA